MAKIQAEPQLDGLASEVNLPTGLSPDIGLEDDDMDAVVLLLQVLLADEFVLYTKTRNYHWNVAGPQFYGLHLLFEQQYTALNVVVDDVAERVVALGGNAAGTLGEYLRMTRLEEFPGIYPAAREMLVDLRTDHEAIVKYLREEIVTCEQDYSDRGTADFLGGLMIQHEKMAWMLRKLVETRESALD